MEDVKSNNRVEYELKSKEEKDISDSYFNGRLVFKTKVVWFPNVIAFIVMHVALFYGFYLIYEHVILTNDWHWFFFGWFIAYLGGEGVSIGAHRLWCHRSYKAVLPIRILLMIMQTIGGQNSIYVWVRDHRQHHKYADTDADPHNANRGFFFAHMGWLMMRKHPEVIRTGKTIDLSDLEKDPVVMFQYRNMYALYIILSVIMPVAIPYFFWRVTLFESVILFFFVRYVLELHTTWSVNSFAHFYGTQPYDKKMRARENYFVSLISSGEGWHNYHHIFPFDYKTAESWWKLNFSAIAIKSCSLLGLTYDLKQATPEMIQRKITKHGDSTFEWRKKVELSEKEQEFMKMEPETYDY